jgi:hypothetical protein
LLGGLFEHPAEVFSCCAHVLTIEALACQHDFPAACSLRQPRNRPQYHPFTTMHPPRFFLTPLMIVAAEM